MFRACRYPGLAGDNTRYFRTNTEVQRLSFPPCFPWHRFCPLQQQLQQLAKAAKITPLYLSKVREYSSTFFD